MIGAHKAVVVFVLTATNNIVAIAKLRNTYKIA